MRSSYSLLVLYVLLHFLKITKSDPDPLQDFCVADASTDETIFLNSAPCMNPSMALPSHFMTSVLSKPGNTGANLFGFIVTLTNTKNMPGSNTQGLTMARIDIAGGGLVPPHAHPRASEVTLVLAGTLLVGFVDTSNRLFTQQLRVGDSFVFPRGMSHFLCNLDQKEPALAISGLNSQNPGSQISSLSNFATKPAIMDDILKKSYRISGQDVERIRKNLGG
ncbi:hypothetical protein MRB53_009346 [Persea americana]|uniref:Uncharacterized protein n=1 Tax=Persea americana TaxID=3435 RepID=A0ACC2LNS3_PERAE|nr:hypothetical protein MRB53_009346 [Persea americana]